MNKSRANRPIDWAESLKLSNNKIDLAEEILSMFIADLPDFKAKIQESLAKGDHETLEQHVHKLHGACCYCGVPKLKGLLNQLESNIKSHRYEDIEDLVSEACLEMDDVLYSYQNKTFDSESKSE